MKGIGWLVGLAVLGAILCVIVPGVITSPTAQTQGIVGSAHDGSPYDAEQQICSHCHTPHNADISVIDAPLWNHEVTTKTFMTYTSSTLNAVVGQPDGSSKLCLSCHDGTVAVDSYGGEHGNFFLTGEDAVGAGPNDLKDDHPVSFVYDSNLASQDGSLFDPSSKSVTIGSGAWTKTGTISNVMLIGGKVQCSSCHDVHNDYVAADNSDPLLKVSKTQSALCLSCHNK